MSAVTFETWHIHPSDRPIVEKLAQEEGMTFEAMVKPLQDLGLVSFIFDGTDLTLKEKEKLTLPPLGKRKILWENEQVRVVYPPDPVVKSHLFIELKRTADGTLEVMPEERVEMQKVANLITSIMKETLGLPNPRQVHFDTVQSQHEPHTFTVELIPAQSAQSFNLEEHIHSYFYTIDKEGLAQAVAHLSAEERAADCKRWQALLEGKKIQPLPNIEEEARIEPFYQKLERQKEAAQVILRCIEEIFRDANVRCKREPNPGVEMPTSKPGLVEKCIFCKPAIVDSHEIENMKVTQLFYNRKPCVPLSSLLLLPRSHLSTLDHLSEEHIEEMHLLEQKVTRVFHQQYPGQRIVSYSQDSWQVGKTCGEVHQHIKLPRVILKEGGDHRHSLRHLIYSINYENEPMLPLEEMAKDRAQWKRWLADLASQASEQPLDHRLALPS